MLQKLSVEEFLQRLASKDPAPGGGSAAALAGAAAAALVSMAAKISKEDKIAEQSERLMKILAGLIDKDAQAFERVIKEKSSQDSLKEAAEIPLQTAKYSSKILRLAEVLAKNCNPKIITDLEVAAAMARTAIKGALLNVKVNEEALRRY